MLHPFIIEQIRHREELVRRRREPAQPRAELPVGTYDPVPERPEEDEDDNRGVIILDLG